MQQIENLAKRFDAQSLNPVAQRLRQINSDLGLVLPNSLDSDVLTRDASGQLVLKYEGLSYFPISRVVQINGKETHLTDRENQLIEALIRQPDEYRSSGELTKEIGCSSNSLRQHVSRLRGKIESDPHRPKIIVHSRQRGYRLNTK